MAEHGDSRTAGQRDPHDYTVEVCMVCGAQLDRSGNGRCPVDRSHWSSGEMVVRVIARSERDRLRSAIENHRAAAPSRNHASPADYELWEALDA